MFYKGSIVKNYHASARRVGFIRFIKSFFIRKGERTATERGGSLGILNRKNVGV